MEKKISFGFSKLAKKPQLVVPPKPQEDEEKIELIESLEGSTINIIGKVEEAEVAPLVIPMTANTTPLEKVKRIKEENGLVKPPETSSEETLEQRAAREIIENLKATEEAEESAAKFTVPLTADEVKLDGAQSSTMDDYENVPISQFGLAMLRGMGWKDEEHKQKKKSLEDDIVVCRPKGLGLGADKAMKQQVKLAAQQGGGTDDSKLVMKKGAFVRILGGKHKDFYGQIEGMDDETGRVFVKLALGGKRESVNEAFVLLVTEKEYKENRKVLNVSKYEEYKNNEGKGSKSTKEDSDRKREVTSEKYAGNGRRRDDDYEEEKSSRRDDRQKKDRHRERSRSRSPDRKKESSSSSRHRRDYDDDERRSYKDNRDDRDSRRDRSRSRDRSSKYDDYSRRDKSSRRDEGSSYSSSSSSKNKRRDR